VVPQQSDAPVPLFLSAREKRLWTWTLAVVVAIYATLGLAGRAFRQDRPEAREP
jgi:hypothetical protein